MVSSGPKAGYLHWGVCVTSVFVYVWGVVVYVAVVIVFVHYSVVSSGKPGISKLWNHLRQRVLWVFNEAVCIHTGLTENHPLEHLRKKLISVLRMLPQIFHMTQRLKNSIFNRQSITISQPLKCQNPKLGGKCLFRCRRCLGKVISLGGTAVMQILTCPWRSVGSRRPPAWTQTPGRRWGWRCSYRSSTPRPTPEDVGERILKINKPARFHRVSTALYSVTSSIILEWD